MASTVKERLYKEIDRMSEEDMERMLQSVASSNRKPGMTVAEALERFGGLIPADELDRMEKAIEEGCEQVYSDGSETPL